MDLGYPNAKIAKPVEDDNATLHKRLGVMAAPRDMLQYRRTGYRDPIMHES